MTTLPALRAEFKAADGGEAAVHISRRINSRGEKGPWSEVIKPETGFREKFKAHQHPA